MSYEKRIEALKKKNILNETQAEELNDVLESEGEYDRWDEQKEFRFSWKHILFISIALLIATTLYLYNSLVNKSEAVDMAWAQVESVMQRKLDLIPNLVKVTKSYAKHESELLTKITSLRASAKEMLNKKDAKKLSKLNAKLNSSMMQIYAIAENYPDLKSSEQFLQLQAQLEGSENRINITRMIFNHAVGVYNSSIRRIPHKYFAKILGLKKRSYFKAEKEAHEKLKLGM